METGAERPLLGRSRPHLLMHLPASRGLPGLGAKEGYAMHTTLTR